MKQIKTTFAGGEFSEALDGRVDLSKYPTGCQLMENFYVTRFGGTSNRQGTSYIDDAIGDVKLIPFHFSVTQTYVLCFSELKMRILKDGGLVLTGRQSSDGYRWQPSSTTNEWYCELSFAGGDPGIVGADEFIVAGDSWDKGTLGSLEVDEYGYGDNDGLGFNTIYMYSVTDPDLTWMAGQIFSDVQVISPFTFEQADELSYAQSADVIYFAHKDVAPTALTRTADDEWTFSTLTFVPTIDAPVDVVTTTSGFTTTNRDWFYSIAAIDVDGEESVPTADQLVQGDTVWSAGDTVSLFWNCIRSSTYKWTQSTSVGNEYHLELAAGGDPSIAEPTTIFENLVEMTEGVVGSLVENGWGYGDNDSLGYSTIYVRVTGSVDPDTLGVGSLVYKATGEDEYAVYKNYRGDWGWIGTVRNPWYLDDGVEGLAARGPQEFHNPFIGTGNYPAAVGFYQQRLIYGRSDNDPQKLWTSQPGRYENFGISHPLSSEDAITARLSSGGSVDQIRHLVPMDRLLVLTDGSEWTFDHGANSDSLTPASHQFRVQGYDGTSTVRPIVIGSEALFVGRNFRDIRSLRFKAEYEGYVGNELTLLVPHLFEGKRVVDWCYQQHPDNIAWIILDDGTMLSFTYIPEQELWAFARHNTDGLFRRCTSITTDGEDEVYFSVERTLGGTTAIRLEQLHDRDLDHVYDSFFVDCGLSQDDPVKIVEVRVTTLIRVTVDTPMVWSSGSIWHIDDVEGIVSDGSRSDYGTFNNKKYRILVINSTMCYLQDLDGYLLTDADGFSGTYIQGGSARECVTSVSGLGHLNGEEVSVCADGMSIGPMTVSDGSLTLTTQDVGFAVVHIGLGYVCNLNTLRLEISGKEDGTVQGSKKTVKKGTFRFWKSSGGKAGPTKDLLSQIKWRQDEDWGDANELTSGDKDLVFKGVWNRQGRVYFRQDEPLPTTILAIITYYEVGGR